MENKTADFFTVKTSPLFSTNYSKIKKQALLIIKDIESRTKRRPYIRSRYFHNQKVFTNLFLSHLFKKNYADRKRRLKFLPCAIELIEKSTIQPDIRRERITHDNLYRFYGKTKGNLKFAVQIKESSRNNKYLISVFPIKR